MLWFVCFFNYADRQAIYSVFPLLKQELGLSDIELGIVGAAFMWVYALSAPLAGWVGDRLPRKTLILGGLIFWSLVTIATALSTKYWHLVLFRGLEGFGEAFYFPASMSLVSDYHGPDTRSKAMSMHQSSVYAGTIAGGVASGYLGQHYGWQSSFYLFGILGCVLGALLWVLLKEAPRGEQAAKVNLLAAARDVYKMPMAVILTAVFVGANFVAMIFLTWMPSFLFRKFQMSLSMAGFSGTAYLQVASVIGVLTGGWLADRMAQRYTGGRMRTQSLGLLLGVPFIFLTGWTMSVPVLILAMCGFGFFKGMYDANIWASLHDVVPAARRASAVGFMNAIGWFGGGVAPVAIAAASERFGMGACLSATSLIYLAFGLLLAWGIKRFLRVPSALAPAYPA